MAVSTVGHSGWRAHEIWSGVVVEDQTRRLVVCPLPFLLLAWRPAFQLAKEENKLAYVKEDPLWVVVGQRVAGVRPVLAVPLEEQGVLTSRLCPLIARSFRLSWFAWGKNYLASNVGYTIR